MTLLLALLLAPLLPAAINRVKARVAGRRGQPWLQGYFDLAKLLRKEVVLSPSTTWMFQAGPALNLAAVAAALTLVPLGRLAAPFHFSGDLLVVLGLLAAGRVALVLAALDTGSAFEGMGASREVQFAALAEPALLLSLGGLVLLTGQLSLTDIYAHPGLSVPALLMLSFSLTVVALAENSRIPVDDPNTHLELTMIHEVMVLDHSGPDLALIHYAQALKLWLLGSLVAGLWPYAPAGLAGMALLIGWIESSRARLRLIRVPQLLVTASAVALVVVVMGL